MAEPPHLLLVPPTVSSHIHVMEIAVESLLAAKGALVFGWIAALFVFERVWPAAPLPGHVTAAAEGRGRQRRLLRNLALWGVNLGLSPLIILPLSYWATDRSLQWRPDFWQGWTGLFLDLLVLDFLLYWWHRANHVVPLLWRFHEVHHLDRFLDTTTALRFHFGEVLLSALARAAIILLLGFPFSSILVFETLVLMAAAFHHSNFRLPQGLERRLSHLVITPSIHWVHHHAIRRDTDSNYGTIFSFWDPVFASRSGSRRDPYMEIGVERHPELPLVQLLIRPFRAAQRSGQD